MGNTLCYDCKSTKTGEICFDSASTAVEPTFKIPVHFEPTLAPELSQQIVVRLTSLQNSPLKIPKCGLIGLQQLPPYCNTIDENVYEGQWLNGKPEGIGKVYYATGNYLEGEFHQGHPCGIVRVFYKDGSYFQGQIVDYVPSGTGKFFTDHFEFEGIFRRNSVLGGVIKLKDKTVVSFNLETGKGTIQFGNKRKYNGDLSQDLYSEGKGRIMLEDGTIQDGQFRMGEYLGESQVQDMRSTSSGIMKKSSKMSNNSSKQHHRKTKQKVFCGITDSPTLSFLRSGLPEIQKVSFVCF